MYTGAMYKKLIKILSLYHKSKKAYSCQSFPTPPPLHAPAIPLSSKTGSTAHLTAR